MSIPWIWQPGPAFPARSSISTKPLREIRPPINTDAHRSKSVCICAPSVAISLQRGLLVLGHATLLVLVLVVAVVISIITAGAGIVEFILVLAVVVPVVVVILVH